MKKVFLNLLRHLIKAFSGTGITKIPGLLFVYKTIFNFIEPTKIVLVHSQGNRMYVHTVDTGVSPNLLTNTVYEPFETKLIQELIKENMTVVNIGANIGYYTLIAARKVGPHGKVYAFEPEPGNYKLLVKNVEENGYKNTVTIRAGVSDKPGILKLFLDKSNLGNFSFAEENVDRKNGFIEVETNSLDNFIEKYDKNFAVDLIQMDTQGAEGLILNGAKKIIAKNNVIVIMEFWPYGLTNMGTDAGELLKAIENYGFKIKVIDEIKKEVNYMAPKKIIEACEHSAGGKGFVNLLLVK